MEDAPAALPPRAPDARTANNSAISRILVQPTGAHQQELLADPFLFDRGKLLAPEFTPEAFIAQYARVGALDDVKRDLHRLQRVLRYKAVEAISRDFPKFVDLTVKLSGLGEETEQIFPPLVEQRSKLVDIRSRLRKSIDAVEGALASRENAKVQKTQLQLLLRIHRSIAKMQDLLDELKADPAESHVGANNISGNSTTTSSNTSSGKSMARVVVEYAQLRYLIDSAGKSAFIRKLDPQIKAIRDVLAESLSESLSETLNAVYANYSAEQEAGSKGVPPKINTDSETSGEEADNEDAERKETAISDLIQIIRLTISIDRFDELIKKFVNDLFVVRFLNTEGNFKLLAGSSQSNGRSPAGHQRKFINIGQFYGSFLNFMDRCKPIIDSVETIAGIKNRYEILMALFDSLTTHIIKEAPSTLFNFSDSSFQQNYTFTMKFLKEYEVFLVPTDLDATTPFVHSDSDANALDMARQSSMSSITSAPVVSNRVALTSSFRKSQQYRTFVGKWSLTNYFKVTRKTLTDRMEKYLATISLYNIDPKSDDNVAKQIKFLQTAVLVNTMQYCWSDRVFLPEVAHDFWELTLKVLLRYKYWVQIAMSRQNISISVNSKTNDIVLEVINAGDVTSDEKLDNLHLFLYSDINVTQQFVRKTLFKTIVNKLESASGCVLQTEDVTTLKEALDDILDSFNDLLPAVSSKVCLSLSNVCSEILKNYVPKIPSLYRMTNREAPTSASQFIPLVVNPILGFIDPDNTQESGASVPESDVVTKKTIALIPKPVRLEWAQEVIETLIDYYYNVVNDILVNVSKFEAYNSKKRTKKNMGNNAGTPVDSNQGSQENISQQKDMTPLSDDSKIRVQLYWDVVEFGRILSTQVFGYKESNLEPFVINSDKESDNVVNAFNSGALKDLEHNIPSFKSLRKEVQEFASLIR